MPYRKRPQAFSAFLYRYRNAVERFFNKIKHFRGIATRHEKEPEITLPSWVMSHPVA